MEKIAFISGETFFYWSPLILTMAAVVAMAVYASVYVKKGGSGLAIFGSIMLSALAGIPLARLVHWYCRTAAYESFRVAMTDYSAGGYALMGVFFGCLIAACLLRLVRVCDNLPRMLDCMAIGGGAGIAVGRLASMFHASDRGAIVSEEVGFPFAYPVINSVSGAVENRLATFMIQSILTAVIVAVLLVYMARCSMKKKKIADGDICLLFLLCYGACQIICDSTRYDSLFFRSNGFVSIVQILGAVALVVAIVVFSVRMVKENGMKWWSWVLWTGILALLGVAGYMEYYVQRHGSEAIFAYSVMGTCLALTVVLSIVIRFLGNREKKTVPNGLGKTGEN